MENELLKSKLQEQHKLLKELNEVKHNLKKSEINNESSQKTIDLLKKIIHKQHVNMYTTNKEDVYSDSDEDYTDDYSKPKTTKAIAKEIKESYNSGTKDAMRLLKNGDPQNELQALRVIDRVSTFGEDWAYKEGARAVKTTIRRAAREARDTPIYDTVDIEVKRLNENGRRMAILR